VYEHGTTTPVTVYVAETGETTLSQPLTANANGQLPGYVLGEQDLDVVASYVGNTAAAAEVVPVRAKDLVGEDPSTKALAVGAGTIPLPSSVVSSSTVEGVTTVPFGGHRATLLGNPTTAGDAVPLGTPPEASKAGLLAFSDANNRVVWQSWKLMGKVNVLDPVYGGKGTGKIIKDATMTAGSGEVTTATTFTEADVGKSIIVANAGGALTIEASNSPTGGTWNLEIQHGLAEGLGHINSLPYNATHTEVQTKLEELGFIGAGNVTVTGGPFNTTPLKIVFSGAALWQGLPYSLSTTSTLTGGGPTPVITVTSPKPLTTTITSVAGGVPTLTATAVVSVTAQVAAYGPEEHAALTTATNAAIAAGVEMEVPGGIYLTNAAIAPGSRVTMTGAGKERTIIVGCARGVSVLAPASGAEDCTIRHMSLLIPGEQTTAVLFTTNTVRFTAESLKVTGGRYGVQHNNATGPKTLDCEVGGQAGAFAPVAIYVNGTSSYSVVERCITTGGIGLGIFHDSTTSTQTVLGHSVRFNRVESPSDNGIRVQTNSSHTAQGEYTIAFNVVLEPGIDCIRANGQYALIIGNRFVGGQGGIRDTGGGTSTNTVLSHSTISNNRGRGLFAFSAGIHLHATGVDNTITGNTITGYNYGMYLLGSEYTVEGNRCFGNYRSGILYQSSINTTVTGNTCWNNSTTEAGAYHGIELLEKLTTTLTETIAVGVSALPVVATGSGQTFPPGAEIQVGTGGSEETLTIESVTATSIKTTTTTTKEHLSGAAVALGVACRDFTIGTNRCYDSGAETKVTAGSNGAVLPQATINVESTAGFPSEGKLTYLTEASEVRTKVTTVSYTGKTATTFTGCTGGVATLVTGGIMSARTQTYGLYIHTECDHLAIGPNDLEGNLLGGFHNVSSLPNSTIAGNLGIEYTPAAVTVSSTSPFAFKNEDGRMIFLEVTPNAGTIEKIELSGPTLVFGGNLGIKGVFPVAPRCEIKVTGSWEAGNKPTARKLRML
jgi:parallel beta-helix repeat protein